MTFNHEAALNGAKIYYEGEEIYPSYWPSHKRWNWRGVEFNTNGIPDIKDETAITTDPPIREETRWIWINPDFGCKSKDEAMKLDYYDYDQLIEYTIKVPKQ